MELAFGMDEEVGRWIAKRMPYFASTDDFGPYRAVGILKGSRMIAGVFYHNYNPTGGHIDIGMASEGPGWATRGILRGLLSIPFEQYNVRRVGAVTPHNGTVMKIDMLPRLGFTREGMLRHFYADGVHGAVFSMTHREYRKRWSHG